MSRAGKILVILSALIFITLQAQKLTQPWVGEFEAGFQEMIALHHLKSGIAHNHFLPVIAEISGEKFYHTAHPPLLHIIYALLYRIFGVDEWVSRGFCLLLLFSSIFLLSQLLAEEKRVIFWLISLFFPISFRLGIITNYEPLTIFAICLFLFCFEKARLKSQPLTSPPFMGGDKEGEEEKKINHPLPAPPPSMGREEKFLNALSKRTGRFSFALSLLVFAFCLILIVLSDWPAYLAIPALFLTHLRNRKERKWLLGLFAGEVICFAFLILYMHQIAGEVALFAHSQTRSNPLYLFQLATYRELFEHLKWILGKPTLILLGLAILGRLIPSPLRGEGKGEGDSFRLIHFWLIFLVLLWFSASNLVSRHFVYLLYFFPLSALLLSEAVWRVNYRKLTGTIVLLSFLFPNYLGLKTKDARFYYLAEKLKGLKTRNGQALTCFASAAIGTLYFYDKIETVVPVNEKALRFFGKENFDLLVLDRESPEVKELARLGLRGNYNVVWEFSDLLVFAQGELAFRNKYLATELTLGNLENWWEPRAEVIYLDHQAYYGLKHPPGPNKISKLEFPVHGNYLCFQPAFYLPLHSGKSDGVNFMIIGQAGEEKRLSYVRFLRDKKVIEQKIGVKDFSQISLITEAGPKANFSYDDAYWLEARIGECGGQDGN